MKNVFLALAAFAFIGAAGAQQDQPKADNPSKAEIKFVESSHNFGSIAQGEIARYDFRFTNNGTEPLLLSNVSASCGCTTPKWPREAIAPGATAVITAEYNSAGREGSFTKYISVYSNGGDATLTIQGIVVVEPEKPKSIIIKQ